METSGKSYEESRSLNQELTFETLKAELDARQMEFGREQMKTLKMIGGDGLCNNLALLLSDQCAHTIKVAVFQGTDNAVFRDRREFSGSLLKQLEDVYAYIEIYNKTEAAFEGLRRTDVRDYPSDAIREDVEATFQVGSTKAYKCIKQLCEERKLVQIPNGNKTVYAPASTERWERQSQAVQPEDYLCSGKY